MNQESKQSSNTCLWLSPSMVDTVRTRAAVVGCGLLPLGRIPTSQGKARQGNAPAVDMPLYPERSSETSFQTIRSVGRSRREKKDSSRPSRPVPSCPAGVSFLRTGRAGFLLVLVLFLLLLFRQDDDDTMIGRMFVGYWCCDTRHIHQRFCCCSVIVVILDWSNPIEI